MDIIDETLNKEAAAEKEREALRKTKQDMKDHISFWLDEIKATVKHDEYYHERWSKDRKVARGESNLPVSVNLISAIMDVLSAFLYAKNPDVSITPSESVGESAKALYREFTKTLEIMVSRMFKDAGLKRQAKRWIRGAQTVGIGWIRAQIQTRREEHPLMAERINDLQDQLQKIDSKEVRIEMGEDDEGRLRSEIESNILAAQAKLELVVAEGLVIDYMDPRDVIVARECGEVENYLAAPWLCFVLYKNQDEVVEITGWRQGAEFEYLKTANRYYKRAREPGDSSSGSSLYVKASSEEIESEAGFYRIYEIWSKEDGVVYTLIDGCTEKWAREKYAPVTGRRFYPVFSLAFHYVDGERYPQSDVSQLVKLQEEYNETRSDYRVHRKRARPGTVFNEEQVDPDSVERVTSAVTEEYTPVKLIGREVDIRTVFSPKQYAAIDPMLYDTTPIQRDMEKMSGAQEALTQTNLQVEKTATEAEIQEAGRGARTGARIDEVEDVLTDLSEYAAQLCLQQMDMADAERYAGPDAVWMNLSTEEALTLFSISIKAGSTGKPKAKNDREAWGTLLPLILDLVKQIGDARMAGKEWAAKPLIAVLKETLARADDTASIEMFLPVIPEEEIAAAGQPDPLTVAKTKLDTAGSIDKAASAVEKLPSLAFSPEVRALLGLPEDREPTVQDLAGALQNEQTQAPAPDPV